VEGKYKNPAALVAAYVARQYLRMRVRRAVTWQKADHLRDGCTAIIGMPHRLPGVLVGNLRCLWRNRWPGLVKVIVVVDSTSGCLPDDFMAQVKAKFSGFSVDFAFYSSEQAALAEKLNLPYVYSWLSWCIALGMADTRHILIHDYDALVLQDVLATRYEKFVSSKASIQGIRWYNSNGILESDRLATTFEAFLDLAWIRQFEPVQLFNQIAVKNGRSLDYDTLLELQDRLTPPNRRDVQEMDEDSLVHPSQMVHQYTMFRRSPGKPLPCFSIAMIPFFNWLSGDEAALGFSTRKLRTESGKSVDLLGDKTHFNFTQLSTANVDWNLKQMIRVCLELEIAPFPGLIDYGDALYSVIGTSKENAWVNGFSLKQLDWIRSASSAH
jgi:hypothetical protein